MREIKSRVLTSNEAISFVRDLRNYEIKKLLSEANLRAYLFERYQVQNPSKIKTTFMWRSLKELQMAPIDLEHYSQILLTLQEDPDHEMLTDYCLNMVHDEIYTAIESLI